MNNLDESERRIVLRILDANANRCAEGLRVIEEMARFAVGNEELLGRLKEIRHSVRRGMDAFTGAPFRFRDSNGDVGKDFSIASENLRGSLGSVERANFARAEEALRVIEEFGKLLRPEVSKSFKRLRFELYTLERDFLTGLGGTVGLPAPPFLYAILDRALVPRSGVGGVARILVDSGVDIIQYRAKDCSLNEKRSDLIAILSLAMSKNLPVIVNDSPELTIETGANGVHLGINDPDPIEARSLLGPNRLIGVTVHSIEQLENVPFESVDYIAVGAIYPSKTKPWVKPVGLEFLSKLRDRIHLPLVAIGGIDSSNAGRVLDAGADGIAIVSYILKGDIGKNCFTLKEIIDRRREKKG